MKLLDQFFQPDPRTSGFVMVETTTGAMGDATIDDQYAGLQGLDLNPNVPEPVVNHLNVTRIPSGDNARQASGALGEASLPDLPKLAIVQSLLQQYSEHCHHCEIEWCEPFGDGVREICHTEIVFCTLLPRASGFP